MLTAHFGMLVRQPAVPGLFLNEAARVSAHPCERRSLGGAAAADVHLKPPTRGEPAPDKVAKMTNRLKQRMPRRVQDGGAGLV